MARDWLKRLDARAVLLRPDRYVAGIARERDELARLLLLATPTPIARARA